MVRFYLSKNGNQYIFADDDDNDDDDGDGNDGSETCKSRFSAVKAIGHNADNG